MTTVNNKNYISTSEAAKILKISRIAVFKKIKSGELKAEKIGRNYVVSREDLKNLGNPIESKTGQYSHRLEKAVDRTVNEYKETLELLASEEEEG
jgi:excisionase family DNA binding protein